MAIQIDVNNVITKEYGTTNIQLNLGNSGGRRETIQRWFAPWLFIDWTGKRSQPTILSSLVAVQGCGLWLLDKVLPSWLSSSQDGIWLTGEVGTGKSVLCSVVIKHLTETRQHDDSRQIVVPLIFSYNDDYTHTAEFVPNTILAYLCSVEPIPEDIITARETHVSPSTISNIEDLIMKVITTLEDVISAKPNTSVVLVVDALDEIPLDALVANLDFLNKLTAVKSADRGVRVRMVLFTRHDDRLQPSCSSELGWQKTVIPRSDVDEDIRTAVTVRLEKGTRLAKADIRGLADQIVAKAEGMFRLASLYVDELLKGARRRSIPPNQLKVLLQVLPPDIDAFYDQILSRVSEALMKKIVFRALRWIMYAARSVWIEDVVEACGILPPLGESLDCDTLDLLECLSGLVRIQPPLSEEEAMVPNPHTHIVSLAHFSVSEYLQRLDTACHRLDTGFFNRHSASLFLSQACFIYLMEASEQLRTSQEHTTMMEYAYVSWPSHVAAYLQTLGKSRYAPQATTAPLSFKIRNSVEFPDLIMYDDCNILRQCVQSIALEIMDSYHCDELMDNILRRKDNQMSLDCDYNSEKPCNSYEDYDTSLYTPLEPGCFRLLIIHPAKEHMELVRCSLVVDYLENKAKYDYLSYNWGPSACDRLVLVNRQPLKTMLNLSKALIGLRDNTKPVLLWVDDICIDQRSVTERNYQVARMGDFVRYASNTLAWLPEETCTSACSDGIHAAKFLQDLHSQAYWHRRWILQELILAQDIRIQWATNSLTWAHLMCLVHENTRRLSEEKRRMQPDSDAATLSAISHFSDIQELRASRAAKKSLPSLEELLYMFRSSLCTVPCDTLYAILPLLSDDDLYQIPPVDYSIGTAYTMTKLAAVLLERAQSYHVLSMVGSDRDEYNGEYRYHNPLPSWVPTWTKIEDYPLAPGRAFPKQPRLYATSTQDLRFEIRENTLCAEGWLVDEIASAVEIPMIMDSGDTRTSAEEGTLVRVLLEDRFRETSLSAFQRMNKKSQDWFAEPSQPTRVSSELLSRGSRATRRIATTSGELRANVPAQTRVGDVIVIFHGSEVPYVLRPKGDCRYILIGECYVDGYMDGEVMNDRTNSIPDVIFHIL